MNKEDAVRRWIINDRIMGDIEWTPIRPGNHGDWRQHSLVRSVLAAGDGCDGGTESGPRRLEDWVGKSSDKIDRGGRPRQESADRGPAEKLRERQQQSRPGRRRSAATRLGPAGKATHRLWRGTPPYRRRCAASSAACSWIPSVQCAPC